MPHESVQEEMARQESLREDMDMPVGNARTRTLSSGTPDDALSSEPLVSPLPPCMPSPPTRSPVSPLAGAMTSGLLADRGDESGDLRQPVESGLRHSTRSEDRQQSPWLMCNELIECSDFIRQSPSVTLLSIC